MTVLVDTSFLLALVFPRDIHHAQARAAVRELKELRLIPAPVLPEVFYMVSSRLHYREAIRVFDLLHSLSFRIENLTDDDMIRMRAIMTQYIASEFDFVDVALMAVAERLRIDDIYTFDRRDFSIFVPVHRSHFRLLP